MFPQGAAERFPDKVERDPEGARKLNVSATSSLAQAAAAKGAFLIYISTDYVFPGKPGDAPYNADAETKPPNLYGQTKLDGEKAALAAQSGTAGSAVVLRVPVLYGSAETPAESAVNVLLDAVWKSQTEDKKITMDHWAPRYPTNTEDVGRVCHGMFLKRHSSFCLFFISLHVVLLCGRVLFSGSDLMHTRQEDLELAKVTRIVDTARQSSHARSIRG